LAKIFHFNAPLELPARPAAVALSPRQREVLLLIARGNSNKLIASALHIAVDTAKQHLADCCEAGGVSGRVELLIWALSNPGVFAGDAVPRGLHKPGCACHSPYCATMRSIPEASARAA
jgi:DNA-binding CsgD family transcriptional regulator